MNSWAFSNLKQRLIESVDGLQYNDALHQLIANHLMSIGGHRKVVVTGMGKAGHIGRKFAATLCSNCIPAVFLHPGEALHGDLGIVESEDLIIAISNSGKTYEVLQTIKQIRKMHPGATNPVYGITSNPESELVQLSRDSYIYPECDEICHMKLTPTTSTVVLEALLSMIVVLASEYIGTGKECYSVRHHGGYLGEKSRGQND